METRPYPRVFTVAAFFVALAAAVYATLHVYGPVIRPILDVLPPFAIAIVFAFLLDPVVGWIQKRGGSREFGVAIVGLSFLVLFLVVGFLLVPKVADQAARLAGNFQTYSDQAQDRINKLLLEHKPLLQKLHLPTTAGDWAKRFSEQSRAAATKSLSFVAVALTSALSKILWLIIIPMATLWILRDLDYIKAKVVHFTPDRHKERLMNLSSAVGGVFGKYVRGMLAVAIIFSAVACAVLSAVGLEYALIIGGVSGLFYLVPYIGVLTIALVTGIAALVQPGLGAAYAGILMGYVVVQSFVVFDLIVTPRVVGGSVGVHPVLTLFSLALGARLFGVVGMVAAVPVAAAFQVALGHWYPQIYDKLKPAKQEKT